MRTANGRARRTTIVDTENDMMFRSLGWYGEPEVAPVAAAASKNTATPGSTMPRVVGGPYTRDFTFTFLLLFALFAFTDFWIWRLPAFSSSKLNIRLTRFLPSCSTSEVSSLRIPLIHAPIMEAKL